MKLARATAAVHARDSTDMHVRASRAERGGGGGEEGRRGTESKGKRAVNMSSQADRTAVCHAGTYSRMKMHVGVYAQRLFVIF